jgi:hypothetical protein
MLTSAMSVFWVISNRNSLGRSTFETEIQTTGHPVGQLNSLEAQPQTIFLDLSSPHGYFLTHLTSEWEFERQLSNREQLAMFILETL